MDFNGLITIAGLFVAIYAVMPRVRRLEISLSFGIFSKLSLLFTVLSIIYLQFYQLFRGFNLTPGLNLARWGITTINASAFIVIIETAFLLMNIKISRVNKFSICKYKEYLLQLLQEKSYTEFFNFITGKIESIYKIYKLEHSTYKVKKSWFKKILIMLPFHKKEESEDFFNKFSLPMTYKPKIKAYNATEIIQELTKRAEVVNAIIEYRPYLAIEVLKYDFHENNDFSEIYFQCLAKNKNSILYDELRNTTNITSSYDYIIPENMRLLYFLFNNCETAKTYGVYKPIGDFVINFLDEIKVSGKTDSYNEPMRDFYEKGKWDSELFLGINFFDRMVGAALSQNIQWHMWLYYFTYFIERIINNLNPNLNLIDPLDEWPTRYHYAIYEIIYCLSKWITSVERIELEQDNIKLLSIDDKHENENIPKSSMIALGQILKIFLMTEKIDRRFKHYIMDIVFRDYFRLKRNENTNDYALTFRSCIASGGGSYRITNEYRTALIHHLNSIDTYKYDHREYEDLLSYFNEQIENG